MNQKLSQDILKIIQNNLYFFKPKPLHTYSQLEEVPKTSNPIDGMFWSLNKYSFHSINKTTHQVKCELVNIYRFLRNPLMAQKLILMKKLLKKELL